MSDDEILKCVIAFILGWLASRMMGNGFSVGVVIPDCTGDKTLVKMADTDADVPAHCSEVPIREECKDYYEQTGGPYTQKSQCVSQGWYKSCNTGDECKAVSPKECSLNDEAAGKCTRPPGVED